jgi:1,2-phenylacetyl-CoA epoxidase catalytic subunit
MRRLAGNPDTRSRLADALARLWPDAASIFAPLNGEAALVAAGILGEGMAAMRARWDDRVSTEMERLGLPRPGAPETSAAGRTTRTDDFLWLWGEFTSVNRSEPGATW